MINTSIFIKHPIYFLVLLAETFFLGVAFLGLVAFDLATFLVPFVVLGFFGFDMSLIDPEPPLFGFDVSLIDLEAPFFGFDVSLIDPEAPFFEFDMSLIDLEVPFFGFDVSLIDPEVPFFGFDASLIDPEGPGFGSSFKTFFKLEENFFW